MKLSKEEEKELYKKMGNNLATIRGSRTQEEIANIIGMNATNYNTIEAKKGERHLKDWQIITLAKKLNTSTDFLLGLTNVETPDIEIKTICNKYGLTENSLDALEGINNGSFIEKRIEKYNIEEYKKLPKTVDKTIIKTINFLLENMLNCTNNNELSLLELISYIIYMDNNFRAEGFGGINGFGLHFQLEGFDALLPKLHLLLNDARNSVKEEGEKNECKRNRKK